MVDLTAYLWIVWLVCIFVFVTIELLTLEFTFLMLAFGSLGGLAANLLDVPWWLQIVIAAVVSVLLILTIRPVLLRLLRGGGDPAKSNIDALIGMRGRVVSTVTEVSGLVKLSNGETWSARLSPAAESPAAGPVVAEPDASVVVSAIDGSIAVVTLPERTLPHA